METFFSHKAEEQIKWLLNFEEKIIKALTKKKSYVLLSLLWIL